MTPAFPAIRRPTRTSAARTAAVAAALLALSATAGHAATVTIDFDALTGSLAGTPLSSAAEDGFALTGADASVFQTLPVIFPSGFSPANFLQVTLGAVSGGFTLSFMESDGSAFSFLGVDALNIPSDTVNGAVEIRGFQGATLVGTDSFLVGDSVTTLSASVLSGLALTKLEMFGELDTAIAVAIDNVRLETEATIGAVPLPAAGWLLIGGLDALGYLGDRRSA